MEYVGIPYKENGTDPSEGLDCYGCVRMVLNSELGLNLPEKPPSPASWPRYVKIFRVPPWDLRPYDVLMFADIIPGLTNHIGIVVSASDFLHAGSQFGGVVLEPIRRYEHRIMAVGRPVKP